LQYRGGLLHEEAELLLRQELPDPLNYFSVLEAVARGATRTSQIAGKTGLEVPQVSQTLRTVERLELVEQRRPATAGPTSTKTSWAILDGFLNFYFRFVEPYRSRLRTRDDAARHLHATVLPQLDHFVSKPAWELICQQHLLLAEEAKSVFSATNFYSRSGFDDGLQRLAQADPDRYKLFTPADLFA
jgi:AAA+ ATPase superfamily predicted ATPase